MLAQRQVIFFKSVYQMEAITVRLIYLAFYYLHLVVGILHYTDCTDLGHTKFLLGSRMHSTEVQMRY